MSDPFSTYDAAYVLDALSPTDKQAFEAHLRSCTACAQGVERLAPIPGLLAQLPAAEVTGMPSHTLYAEQPSPAGVPAGLLPGLLADVRRRRRRRQWATSLAGVVAAACVAAAVVVGFAQRPSAGPAPVAMRPLSASAPLQATAQLVDKPWGTHIVLHCRYDGGSSAYVPGVYSLVVTDRVGSSQLIATWTVQPGQLATIDGSTSVPDADIASIQVRNAADTPMLTLTP
ncbi:MAG: anti-sigma factor family protein [Nocardioidaceae bacterium]